MTESKWDARYEEGDLPWDTGRPDRHIEAFLASGPVSGGRALEIGCGTGTNSLAVAAHGFEVRGIDISPRAVERARAKLAALAAPPACTFEVHDVQAEPLPGGPYDLVLDRGCFHSFDDPADRARYAERVAAALKPGGHWFSLIGSAEGVVVDVGPPRRTAREIVAAIEPVLQVVSLRQVDFDLSWPDTPRGWACLSRVRDVPASTERG